MRKLYILLFLLLCASFSFSQELKPCSGYVCDNEYYRYTAEGRQQVIRGDHSKAINESRRIARITAESELASMINSLITRLIDNMTISESFQQIDLYVDTARVSSLRYFDNMVTICESKPQLVGDSYVVYVTKEISINNIGRRFINSISDSEENKMNIEEENKLIELLHESNSK